MDEIEHVWIGNFTTADDFLEYLTNTFETELGLEDLDRRYLSSYYSMTNTFDSILVNLPVDLKEFIPAWKTHGTETGNSFVCLPSMAIEDADPQSIKRMMYVGAFFK